jgi:hypothetical protein
MTAPSHAARVENGVENGMIDWPSQRQNSLRLHLFAVVLVAHGFLICVLMLQ